MRQLQLLYDAPCRVLVIEGRVALTGPVPALHRVLVEDASFELPWRSREETEVMIAEVLRYHLVMTPPSQRRQVASASRGQQPRGVMDAGVVSPSPGAAGEGLERGW